ncbi:MAG: AAA family ATPase [Dehalococcoidia bacterium]|jgi:hypothetical protein|nr:AAA family ATPase [Dehalococcoidia bacterium]
MASTANRRESILKQLRSAPTGATAAGLAEQFGVTVRTIYRDVTALRDGGEPFVADRGRGGGIHLSPEVAPDVSAREPSEGVTEKAPGEKPNGATEPAPGNGEEPVRAGPRRPADVFVGRDNEIERLDDLLAKTQTGTGGVAMLVGEPGIGKSHTAHQFASNAVQANATVLWGRCREAEGLPSFWPWIQIIRARVESLEAQQLQSAMGPGASDIAELVPEVAALMPGMVPATPLKDPAVARFRLFDSIARFLKALAVDRPLVLILDDLQWADAPSLSLLEFVAVEAASSPIAILGTYRDSELGRHHPLSQTLGELARSVRVDRLALSGMSRDEVARYMLETTGIHAQGDFIAAVHERTSGNPLFVGEYVRLLVQPGDWQPDEWQQGNGGDATRISELSLQGQIPQGVRDVVGRRLDHLSEDCNVVLTAAAVISREFGLRELKLAAGLDEVAILEALESATRALIIEPVGTGIGRYQFRHDLVRQTLYEELSTLDRVRLHRTVGDAIEALRQPNLEPVLPQLAFHYFEAARSGDAQKAVKYCVDAGAVRYFRMAIQALELSGPVDPAGRCELLLALGEACRVGGDFTEAMEVFREVCETAEIIDSPRLLADAAIGFEDTSWRPGMPGHEAVGFLDSALEANPDEEREIRIQLLASLYRALVFAGEHERAGQVWLDSVELARNLEAPEMLKTALRVRLFDRGRGESERTAGGGLGSERTGVHHRRFRRGD